MLRHGGLAAAIVLLAAHSAFAAEPVRRIAIYVQPYYEAARTPGGASRVAVGQTYDGLLASNNKEDILAAKARIETDPGVVTPMTMMVLAIRLYDVGLRDDALFWFYVAKARYTTLEDVIDIRLSGLIGPSEAIKPSTFLPSIAALSVATSCLICSCAVYLTGPVHTRWLVGSARACQGVAKPGRMGPHEPDSHRPDA